jgi:hypothetical protein
VSGSRPAPSYSSGTMTPSRPISASSETTSAGKRCSRSRTASPGAIRSSAKRRTCSWIRSWSSEREKSIPGPASATVVAMVRCRVKRPSSVSAGVGELPTHARFTTQSAITIFWISLVPS